MSCPPAPQRCFPHLLVLEVTLFPVSPQPFLWIGRPRTLRSTALKSASRTSPGCSPRPSLSWGKLTFELLETKKGNHRGRQCARHPNRAVPRCSAVHQMQPEEPQTRPPRQLGPSCGDSSDCGDLNAEVLRSQQKLLRKKENRETCVRPAG